MKYRVLHLERNANNKVSGRCRKIIMSLILPRERSMEQLLSLLNFQGLLAKLRHIWPQKTKKSLSHSKFPTKISLNTRSNPGQTLKSF